MHSVARLGVVTAVVGMGVRFGIAIPNTEDGSGGAIISTRMMTSVKHLTLRMTR